MYLSELTERLLSMLESVGNHKVMMHCGDKGERHDILSVYHSYMKDGTIVVSILEDTMKVNNVSNED